MTVYDAVHCIRNRTILAARQTLPTPLCLSYREPCRNG
jgi:hypothetical protein